MTPASSAKLRSVREREERVRGEDCAGEVVPVLGGLLEREADGVDPARLAAADADRLQVLRDHDRVRGDVLGDPPGEEEVAPALSSGCDSVTTFMPSRSSTSASVSWTRKPAEHPPIVAIARAGAAALAVAQDPQRLLRPERRERVVVVVGRDQHLDELARRGADASSGETLRLSATTPP